MSRSAEDARGARQPAHLGVLDARRQVGLAGHVKALQAIVAAGERNRRRRTRPRRRRIEALLTILRYAGVMARKTKPQTV